MNVACLFSGMAAMQQAAEAALGQSAGGSEANCFQVALAALQAALDRAKSRPPGGLTSLCQQLLLPARQLAEAVQAWWQRPEGQQERLLQAVAGGARCGWECLCPLALRQPVWRGRPSGGRGRGQ